MVEDLHILQLKGRVAPENRFEARRWLTAAGYSVTSYTSAMINQTIAH